MTWAAGRLSPWVEIDPATADPGDLSGAAEGAVVRLRTVPGGALVGAGATVESIPTDWRLDDGWRGLFESLAARGTDLTGSGGANTAEGVAPGAAVSALHGERGDTLRLPPGWGTSADDPWLLVVTGGASLDATGSRRCLRRDSRRRGRRPARRHPRFTVPCSPPVSVDFGGSGEVVFSRSILRWATDRSLVRARLVPGTRSESIQ